MGKRHLYQSKHPFHAQAFEAFCWASWRAVEHIRVENGTMTAHLTDNQYVIKEKRPFLNFRVRSRQATLTDCTCFLRPGVDVCVFLSSQQAENSDEENSEPVWLDAQISSIERKPHESQCSCQFYINLYANQSPFSSEKVILEKETEVVGIHQISILQKLERHPCVDQHYRWSFSEDCSSLQRTKLLLGKFSSDVSWLLVASFLKRISFDIKSVQSKIVYQIVADHGGCSSGSHLSAVNFRGDDGVQISSVFQFSPADTVEERPASVMDERRSLPFNEVMDLRRSKRRNVQPDRFAGFDRVSEIDTGWARPVSYKTDKWEEEEDEEEEELFLPLSRLFGLKGSSLEGQSVGEIKDLVHKSKIKEGKVKTGAADQRENHGDLAIIPVPEAKPLALEQHDFQGKFPRNCSEEVEEMSYKYYCSKRGWGAVHRKKNFQLDEMGFDSKSEGIQGRAYNGRVQIRSHRSIPSRKEEFDEPKTYKKVTLSAGAYNKLINSYMKKIDCTMTNKEPHVIDQWEDFKAANCPEKRKEMKPFISEDDGETSENEMLWREMELSMASVYLLDDNEVKVSEELVQRSSSSCQHDYRLNEEIGICCLLCGSVSTEIKHVSAPFLEYRYRITENKLCSEEDTGNMTDEDGERDLSGNHASTHLLSTEENDNVWALIPELKKKLHFHQKKAYEFLWQNIAGSLVPAKMESESDKIGGCVISHTPGAGKTFLIIAFLVSYLKLFPGKRPLVLAPKTTLYTWYKEFIKWEIPIPVHLIHGRRTYRVFKQKTLTLEGVPRPSQDVMHVLDCLEKLQKWHAQPSVLVMGYTSFLTLIREDSKFAHRKYMAKVLRQSPGLLVLDEGHNPRSTKSRLRKVLMKVETDLRILLSGTLFQNNFCEYFNTLCLARPKFVDEVLKELDPKFQTKKQGMGKARNLLEARARKFFLDKIARKIDSNEGEERMQGLNMLRNLTNGFIDVYEAGSSDTLPGLQIYTLMMNSTDIQHETLVKLHKVMDTYNGYPLELELLITLASIHPWLVRTSNCVNKFFSVAELMELERFKYDTRKGSKVMFVLNLVYRVVKKEKVLIFCHNIAPIHLFLELFKNVFRWQKGRELLVLTGDLELFERGRVMDKFEEPNGPSRVLLASITACAEGVSLTAASRVILLDSEWNPSKTKQAIARAFRPGQQKVVYVYQLLARDTLEEDKYRRTTWKEWVSSMIFSEAFVEDPSRWQAEKIEDPVLREIVEEDKVKSFHMIMKNEKASTG